MQAPRIGRRHRRADDAAGVADDERHLLRRAERGGDDEVALVLAVIVIGDDDDLATGEGGDGLGNAGMDHGSSICLSWQDAPRERNRMPDVDIGTRTRLSQPR